MAASSTTRAVSRREIFLIVITALFMGGAIASFFYIQSTQSRNQGWLGLAGEVDETIGRLERIARETGQGIEPDVRALSDLPFEMEELFVYMREGDEFTSTPPLAASLQPDVDGLEDAFNQVLPAIEQVVDNQVPYRRSSTNVVVIGNAVDEASALIEQAADRLSQRGDTQSAFLAATQLARLQALKNATDGLIGVGTDPEAVSSAIQTLASDIAGAQQALLASGLDAVSAELVNQSTGALEPIVAAVTRIVQDTPGLIAFQQAGTGLLGNVTSITTAFATLDQGVLDITSGEQPAQLTYILGGLAVLSLALFLFFFLSNARRQVRDAQERDTAQQEAILSLLDEITNLADGDLTVDVTVTEDFTGAIADSINYTVASMRGLVGTINSTAGEIAQSANNTEQTARQMTSASDRQAKEITAAASSMTQMSQSMQEVAKRAEQIAGQAQQSVEIAKNGASTVGRTIDGMTALREQIQDTAKRIKRLGESSQEIGNIIEFINDISEQTNTLALNASIQAAMAGEAGRGFAVVADEVQRLAERASNATRQIETLVKTIQADTSEAIVSMERSTANVVSGAKSAEEAGQALSQIESSSNTLAGLISEISESARQQSGQADKISGTMQVVREIAVQTSSSAANTARAVGELNTLSDQLKVSVEGFKLPDQPAANDSSGGSDAA